MTTTFTDQLTNLADTLNALPRRSCQVCRDEAARAVGKASRELALTMIAGPVQPPAPAAGFTYRKERGPESDEDAYDLKTSMPAVLSVCDSERPEPSPHAGTIPVGLWAALWGLVGIRRILPAFAVGFLVGLAAVADRPILAVLLKDGSVATDELRELDSDLRPRSAWGPGTYAERHAAEDASAIDGSIPNHPIPVTCLLSQPSLSFQVKEESMNTTTMTNDKRPRKQLSDQLDRLDELLDTLGNGLNDAVAEAAREGTRLAVKDAVVEMMTDPTLRARLHQATAPEPAAEPTRPQKKAGFWSRLKIRAGEALQSLGRLAANVASNALHGAKAVATTVVDAVRSVRCLGRLTAQAAAVSAAGVAVAVARYVAPQAVVAVWSSIRGAAAVLASQLGGWAQRTARALSMV
jgi:hypothetical protein